MYTKRILYTNKQNLHKHDPGTASVVLKLRHTRRQPSTYLQRRESPTATFPLETHTFLEILPKLVLSLEFGVVGWVISIILCQYANAPHVFYKLNHGHPRH